MNMLTVAAPRRADIVTSAQRVLPGDLLLDANSVPVVLVTRVRTRRTGKQVTQIEGEWLVTRPAGAPTVFRHSTLASTATYVRRGA